MTPAATADGGPSSTTAPVDWLIVGGGLHGVHVATRLVAEAGVAVERIRIVDPGDRLLSAWRRCTTVTGMSHLRSPAVHHLDVHPFALRRFVSAQPTRRPDAYVAPYDRPALDLFDAHCDAVIDRLGLAEAHVRGHVARCEPRAESVRVHLDTGSTLEARRVVLAVGASEQPARPRWAPAESDRVGHVFGSALRAWPSGPNETIAVVGGGISAVQVGLRLIDEGHEVRLLTTHPLRAHQFDSDPGWLGPKYMAAFDRQPCLERRREMIQEARHRGSVTPQLMRRVEDARASGQLLVEVGPITQAVEFGDHVELRTSSVAPVRVDRLLFATGFETRRPGGPMVDDLVATAKLPVAPCGYPVVDSALRWHPRIHVTGPLADLALGPASRNIAGARRAGDRIVDVLVGATDSVSRIPDLHLDESVSSTPAT